MNINDINDDIKVPKNIWLSIFKHQMKLAQKYSEIEGMGDLLETLDNNINTIKGQKWIKDFAWRVTEELAEAQEAYDIGHDDHFHEELIDALHFLVELTIISGHVNYKPQVQKYIKYESNLWDVVYELGLMCNCLKNKPWKQSHMLTDKAKFTMHLNRAWVNFITTLYALNLKDEDIFKIYFKKNRVNQFRIRSKY